MLYFQVTKLQTECIPALDLTALHWQTLPKGGAAFDTLPQTPGGLGPALHASYSRGSELYLSAWTYMSFVMKVLSVANQ